MIKPDIKILDKYIFQMVAVATFVGIIAFILKTITPYINELHKIFESSGLNSNYFFTVLK